MAVVAGDRGEPPKPNVAKLIYPPKPNGTRTIEPLPQPQASTGMSIQGSSVQQLVLAAPTAGLPTSSTDSKASDQKELPAVFFTSLYPPGAPTMPGWQRAPQFGMGYVVQYPAGMAVVLQIWYKDEGAEIAIVFTC